MSPGDTVRAALPACLLVLLLGCVLWIYYPGINGPALLDDYSSLGDLGDLAETPEQFLDYVLGDNSGPLGRWVSMATFVAGEFLGGGIAGAKLVNIVIHLVTGALVAWFFTLLLAPLRVPGYRVAAILCAGLWLLAPLQVSTVLYLVQRMAQLAALFGLLSLICYLYWRRSIGSNTPRSRLADTERLHGSARRVLQGKCAGLSAHPAAHGSLLVAVSGCRRAGNFLAAAHHPGTDRCGSSGSVCAAGVSIGTPLVYATIRANTL